MAERILVDTVALSAYSSRIQKIIQRLNAVNSRIRSLYYTRDVTGIYSFVTSNRFSDEIQILKACITYIDNTVRDFEIIDDRASNIDPLNFTEAQFPYIHMANAKDNNGNARYVIDDSAPLWLDNKRKSNDNITSDILDGLGKLFKLSGKISANDSVQFGASTWGYFTKVLDFISNTTDPMGLYTGMISLVSATGDIYNAYFDYLCEGKYGTDLMLRYGEKYFAPIPLFTTALDTGLSTLNTIEKYFDYRKGNVSGYDLASSVIDTTGSGVGFAGQAVMFYNWGTPGQVQILSDGTVTSGVVKNTDFLKNAASYLRIGDAMFTFASTYVGVYGEYAADGDVSWGEHGNLGVKSSLQALNKLHPLSFLISEEMVDSAADFLIEDFGGSAARNLAEYDWYWEYTNFQGNTLTNNLIARGAATVGATAIAMGETVCDGINLVFDAVDTAAEKTADWIVGGLEKLINI